MIQSNSKKEVSVDSSQRKIKLEDIAILLLGFMFGIILSMSILLEIWKVHKPKDLCTSL